MATPPREGNGTSVEATKSRGRSKLKKPNFHKPMEMVTFYIGEGGDAEGFQVHKEFACHYSPVFNAAFNSQFIEGTTQTYRIEDTTPAAFKLLVQWLYKQTFDVAEDGGDATTEDKSEDTEKDSFEESTETLCQLWVLADRLQLPRLQNMAMDRIQELSNDTLRICTRSLRYIYQNTADDSPLRQFFIRMCALESNPDAIFSRTEGSYLPQAFLLDLAIYMRTVITGQGKRKRLTNMERFHVPELGS